MKTNTISFVVEIASNFSELSSAIDEHLEENYEEILPHLLMADYFRIACEFKFP